MSRRIMPYMIALCLVLAVPLLAATFEFNTINPFLSVETSGRGINNEGDVVGDFANAAQEFNGTESGYRLHEGKFKKIVFPGANDTDANGINNEGDVVGTYDTNSGDHGYVYSEGKFIALPDPPNSTSFPDFNAINDEGDIVGVLTPNSGGGNRGFLFSEGVYTVLNCGRNQTEANGINDDGDIVGECSDSGNVEHAFLLHEGVYTVFDKPGALGTVAFGINEDGDIVGVYTDPVTFKDHGFIVKDLIGTPKWKTIDFPGALDTKVAGINDDGEIAGTYTQAVTLKDKGFRAEKED